MSQDISTDDYQKFCSRYPQLVGIGIQHLGPKIWIMFNALQNALFADLADGDEPDEKTINTLNGMLNSLMRGMGVTGSIAAAAKDVLIDIEERTHKTRPEYFKSVFEALNVAPPLDVKVSKWVRYPQNFMPIAKGLMEETKEGTIISISYELFPSSKIIEILLTSPFRFSESDLRS